MREASHFLNSRSSLGVLLIAAVVLVYALSLSGGVMRVNQASAACPDWPTCLGHWAPPAGEAALLAYLHRLLTVLTTAVTLGSAVLAWKQPETPRMVRGALVVAVLSLGVQILLGAAFTWDLAASIQRWASLLHQGLSALLLASAVLAVIAWTLAGRGLLVTGKPGYRTWFGRLSLIHVGLLFLLMASGSALRAGAGEALCSGWPLCSPLQWPLNQAQWLHLAHRLLVALVAGLQGVIFIQAWKKYRTHSGVFVATTLMCVLFYAQALLGARMVAGFPVYLLAVHQATAVAVWAAAVGQAALTGLLPRSEAEELAEAGALSGRRGLGKDLLALTKPIVVALLLVTTFAGMVIGARQWPDWHLVFWTLLAGFMAAGGSGALNQYIDRADDGKMQRTQRRPIPSGRLTPGEGLAFGLAMALGSFYLMLAFVNLLAALLSLAGIIYYVVVYSLLLKKTTVQNIVIGGGAGAIPPLVGWAAATGSLSVPSALLFAVVFLWTPPHFWALALVRRRDYARAGVPMLPVVRGEAETRRQIFLYTLQLVALTLLLPVIGLGGWVYVAGASLLGAWLLSAAWRVWRRGGNALAWKMYRYSSMYLAFLFMLLMADALILG